MEVKVNDMKQTVPPCSILAAAGTQEMMNVILSILRELQSSVQQTGLLLRITQARTITEIKQKIVPSGAAARPEILLYSMSRSDAACLDDLLLIAGKNPLLQIVLLVRSEVQAQIAYRCRNYQIYVLSLPLRRQVLTEMLRMLLHMRGRLMEKEEELQRMRRKMNEMGVVTRAKCLLIQMRQMTEEEAHYYLEKCAMDEGLSKKEVAAAVIRLYS